MSTSNTAYQFSICTDAPIEITYVGSLCKLVPPYKHVPVVGTYKQYHKDLVSCMWKFPVETYYRIIIYLYPVCENILEVMGKLYVEILIRIVPPYKNIPNVSTQKIQINIEKIFFSPVCVEEGQTRENFESRLHRRRIDERQQR